MPPTGLEGDARQGDFSSWDEAQALTRESVQGICSHCGEPALHFLRKPSRTSTNLLGQTSTSKAMFECHVCNKPTTPCVKCLDTYPSAMMVMSKYTPPGNPPPMTTQCYCCKMEKQQKGSFFSMLQNRTDTEDLNQELGGLTAMLKLNGFPAWERSFSKGWIRPFLALVSMSESDRVSIGMKIGIRLMDAGSVRFSAHQEAWLLISHPQDGLMRRAKTIVEKLGGKSLNWIEARHPRISSLHCVPHSRIGQWVPLVPAWMACHSQCPLGRKLVILGAYRMPCHVGLGRRGSAHMRKRPK
ncbi:hypothetical protein CYMTET_24707 [Cymbomonas tetramitiformis]|uniref:Uncharacterized protein n=1 Tax=Cymbomonas tetramitiformis TaxID=36881 RepID=A0AAE0KZY4_9CHLO|nr:hypothetical protein CYMTET_24707 [Cymbomonas tetramitiformis]